MTGQTLHMSGGVYYSGEAAERLTPGLMVVVRRKEIVARNARLRAHRAQGRTLDAKMTWKREGRPRAVGIVTHEGQMRALAHEPESQSFERPGYAGAWRIDRKPGHLQRDAGFGHEGLQHG